MAVPSLRRRARWLVALGVAMALGVVSVPTVTRHLRAASMLLRASGDHGRIAGLYDVPITTEDLLLRSPHGTFRARVYRPVGNGRYRGLVLAHGVHYLGIDEPRLVPFARTLARSGLVVLTPELAALADYQVQGSSVDELRVAVDHLAHRPEVSPGGVGVMGLSFAGGLALRAVSDPAVRSSVAYVVSVGGHDDLYRVTRFLVTDVLTTPEGEVHAHAHDYGLTVFFYAYAARFVQGEGLLTFRDALRLLLQGKRPEALRVAGFLTGDTRTLFDRIAAHDKPFLQPLVAGVLPSLRDDMARASPAGHLRGLRMPVFLLHGAADDVIPPAEARFAAQEIGPGGTVHLLVTTAIRHVSVEGQPSLWQRWQIVHFMAGVLDG